MRPRFVAARPHVAVAPVHYIGMQGLGDNIYQRAFVKAVAARGELVYLSTPWPELYADLPLVRCIPFRSRLRTQAKNEARAAGAYFSGRVMRARVVRVGYGANDLTHGRSIFESMGRSFGIGNPPTHLDLPETLTSAPWANVGRPLAIIRPPTVRQEWRNEARPCLPQYIAQIARMLMRRYYVLSIADLQDGAEWLVGEKPPPANARLHRGELSTMQMLDLCRRAAVLVGPASWIAPFGIASSTPTFVVLGGQGGHNSPKSLQPDWLGPGKLGFGVPDHLCGCGNMRHTCDKTISDLPGQFRAWASQRGLRI